jgi:VanZ family protein
VLLAVAVTGCSYLAFTPIPVPLVEHVWDKAKHVAAFAVLATLTDFSFPRRGFDFRKVSALLAYGVFIEVVQYFLPYRSAEVLDVVADSIGLLCYWLATPALRRAPLLRRRWRELI